MLRELADSGKAFSFFSPSKLETLFYIRVQLITDVFVVQVNGEGTQPYFTCFYSPPNHPCIQGFFFFFVFFFHILKFGTMTDTKKSWKHSANNFFVPVNLMPHHLLLNTFNAYFLQIRAFSYIIS